LLGQLVGERYQVERRLGEGGMGEVYLARHILMDRACALKVMSPALSRDSDAVTRFNREATSASRISHPNVCAVYDFGLTSEGLVYLAMEYVEGRTLTAVLEESGPMALPRAAALLQQCAAGLQAAHDLGIVHRDLKPDNLMVVAGRGGETAKLVDFGIAKAMESAPGERVTKSGFVIGTPEYMSPEQLAGDPVDGRSDQYALALVFYRLLTGQLPFEGSSLQETLAKRLTDPPRPLVESRPGDYPAGLQDSFDRALARQAEQRYGSVAEFAGIVDALVRGDQIPTRKMAARPGPEIPPTRRQPALSHRTPWLAIGGAGAVVVAGGAVALLMLTRDRGDAGATPPPPPPSVAQRDSLRSPASVTPAAPAPVSSPPRSAVRTVTLDTAPLDLEALNNPARMTGEIKRATQLLSSEQLSAGRRAEAAYFLAMAALDAHKRDSALLLSQMAWRLDGKPMYRQLIQSIRDSIRP
jgi:serine/threonine-protein kinase